ncbi:sugar porter family MFS transporter [Cyclobacterium amurskyense]|uniref:D-xylose proton-symporter XylE n=1 Tax=Cyclobacterium amurskyense TaxID=320787 RepID=A0A0H4PBR9_9BACT|nr:sugar porter family MFS transporter [Cyclobacterium amurskyense]AKP50258.1 D-xylose proton-symporter XylE [Cyclobacterium amurskyense]|tara:strand:- start:85137 stop:86480 length:1344 start_codon:yes stop_codon:yes gene_type:complete
MKINSYVLFLSLVAALGGFLFGFDTAVISGAERQIQELWSLSDWSHGLAIAIALYGTVIGALFGGIPADKYGRKKSLIWIGILFFVSALGSAIAPEIYSFMIFRFIGGLGVGASSVVAPMYISEISPAKNRGQLVALYQFNLVFGILMAYLSNYLIDINIAVNSWRWMLGMEAIPALIYTLLVLRVPQSPRWLIAKWGDFEKAEKILKKTDPEGVEEAVRLALEEKKLNKVTVGFMALFNKKYIKITMLAIFIALFNQLSGINAIIYFAPRIFDMAGISAESALLSTVGIGVINIVATMLGLFLIDRIGRKKLMYIGSFGYIVSLLLIAFSFSGAEINSSLLPIFVFMFIASHAVGQGAVIWVFISEIFPNELRAHGQSMGCFTHWILAAIIANVFPLMANQFGPMVIFGFFALMMLLQLVWVFTKMPETKGRSLEEIQKEFVKDNG